MALMAGAAYGTPYASASTKPQPLVVMNPLPIQKPSAYPFEGTERRGMAFVTGAVAHQIHPTPFAFALDASFPTTATWGLHTTDDASQFRGHRAIAQAFAWLVRVVLPAPTARAPSARTQLSPLLV